MLTIDERYCIGRIGGYQSWYQYKKQGKINRFSFEWLGEEIADGLNVLSDTTKFTMEFREYPDAESNTRDQAEAILNGFR